MFQFDFFQKEWLDKFEQAKKARFVQEQQKREAAGQTERSPSRPSHSESLESPSNRELLIVVSEVHSPWLHRIEETFRFIMAVTPY
jgi:hypothetical protein